MQKIYIASCVPFKSGVKNGRKWNLYNVVDGQGVKYSSFADLGGFINQEIEREVKEETVSKDGKTYINRTILEPKRTQNDSQAQLDRIERFVIDLHRIVSEGRDKSGTGGGVSVHPLHMEVEEKDLPL